MPHSFLEAPALGAPALGAPAPEAATAARPQPVRRCLHVFNYFRPDFTGEGIYFEKLERYLRRDGISSDIIVARTAPRPDMPSPDPGGLTIRYFGAPGRGRAGQALRVMRWLLRHAGRYDFVHFHCQVERYYLVPLICRLRGATVIHSCTLDDSAAENIAGYRPLWQPLIRRLVKLVNVYVAISPRLYDLSLGVMGPARVRFVPQGVELPPPATGDRAAARRAYGYDDSHRVLLFVGGICRRKDVRFLIEAMPRLLARDDGLRLLVVGPDLEDDYAAAVRARVSELGLDDRITFLGPTRDPLPLYALADMMVFASQAEGFGNVLVEAMASGLPPVSRRLPGVTDYIIEDGVTGGLFEDEDGYADRVLRLAADPAYRHRLGTAARRDVETRFAMPTIAAQYVALYREGQGSEADHA